LTIASDEIGSPTSVPLTGTAQDFSLAATYSTVSVSPGGTAVYTLNISPLGGFNQPVTLACSGVPAQSTCSMSPSSITLNGSSPSTATVTVTTTGSAAGMTAPFAGQPIGNMVGSWLASSGTLGLLMMLASLVALRRDLRRQLAVCGFTLLLLLAVGSTMPACSGGSNSGGGGTPAGSYTLTVTGTFTSSSTTLSHATKLTLIVQ